MDHGPEMRAPPDFSADDCMLPLLAHMDADVRSSWRRLSSTCRGAVDSSTTKLTRRRPGGMRALSDARRDAVLDVEAAVRGADAAAAALAAAAAAALAGTAGFMEELGGLRISSIRLGPSPLPQMQYRMQVEHDDVVAAAQSHADALLAARGGGDAAAARFRLEVHGVEGLPGELLARCRGLKELDCSGMRWLRRLEGLPAGLRALRLDGCARLGASADFSALVHATALLELGLSGVGLRGAACSALALALPALRGLQVLRLAHNNMGSKDTGSLAPGLLGLSGLTTLELQGNKLRGGIVALVPALQRMGGTLRELNLNGNWQAATAGEVEALAAALDGMHEMEVLNLGLCIIDGPIDQPQPQDCPLTRAIHGMPKLRVLDLKDADIVRDVAVLLSPLTLLQELTVSERDGLGMFEDAALLAPMLQHLTRLRKLFIGYNCMSNVAALQPALAAMSGLQELDLSGVNVTVEGEPNDGLGVVLGTLLSPLTGLTTLILASNDLGAERVAPLGPVLARMTGLHKLGLPSNKLGDDGCAALIALLPSVSSLKELDLSRNNIGAAALTALAPGLAALTGLTTLDLWGNPVSGAAMGAALRTLPGLTDLGLGNSQLGAAGLAALTPALAAQTGLRRLDMRHNNDLTQQAADALTAALSDMPALNELLLNPAFAS